MPRLGNIVTHVQTINDTKQPATLARTSFFRVLVVVVVVLDS